MKVEKICSVPGCESPHKAKGLCSGHYSRLLVGDVRQELRIGYRTASNLPNPWAEVAPVCPRCGSSEWVFLWANEGEFRWFCQPCRSRFDVSMERVA